MYRSQRYRHENEGIAPVSVDAHTPSMTSIIIINLMCTFAVQILPLFWSSVVLASHWHGVLLHVVATDDDD